MNGRVERGVAAPPGESDPRPPTAGDSEIAELYRVLYGQLVASLTRAFGIAHLDQVEDSLQEAFVRALRLWPFQGVPDNPRAWLLRVARNRLIDGLRRRRRWNERESQVVLELTRSIADPGDPNLERELADGQAVMLFACCTPELPEAARVALTLKIVGGFGVEEIARAFLEPKATVAQRLVRAKRALVASGASLQVPAGDELIGRLDSVLDVLYSLFTEGHAAHAGDSLVRLDLCSEALRLAELLSAHAVTGTPKTAALAALICFHSARLPARSDPEGELVLLAHQDRSAWDQRLVHRGLEHLQRSARSDQLTRFHLEAEIASCHAIAPTYQETDWRRILHCYDLLLDISASPLIALNRIIALVEVQGARPALNELESLRMSPRHQQQLEGYYPLHATRGQLLAATGRPIEAAEAYRRALSLTENPAIRRFLTLRIG